MISPFYFYLLLGFVIELVYDIVFINSGTTTPVDDKNDDVDDNKDNVDKDKNPFKVPAIPKRKAVELDRKPELPQQDQDEDEDEDNDEDDETTENLKDLNRTLKQVRKAIILDRRLPDSQKSSNHHLKDIMEEFSSYFDEESGNDSTEGLKQVENMLKEEASTCRREKLTHQQQKQQEEQQLDNQSVEQNNPPLKKKKGEDLLEDIPMEMPSYMDDFD